MSVDAPDESTEEIITSFNESWCIGDGVQELLHTHRALSVEEINKVGHYLAQKYGLTWNEEGGFWET